MVRRFRYVKPSRAPHPYSRDA